MVGSSTSDSSRRPEKRPVSKVCSDDAASNALGRLLGLSRWHRNTAGETSSGCFWYAVAPGIAPAPFRGIPNAFNCGDPITERKDGGSKKATEPPTARREGDDRSTAEKWRTGTATIRDRELQAICSLREAEKLTQGSYRRICCSQRRPTVSRCARRRPARLLGQGVTRRRWRLSLHKALPVAVGDRRRAGQ